MFKSITIAAVLGFTAIAAHAEPAKLTVDCQGLQPKGAVLVALYSNAADYAADANARYGRVEVTGAKATVSFDGLPEGEYAFKSFHDVDGDGRMGMNPFGLPTEPFAFSNNAVGNMGPAKWEAARFSVKAPVTTQTITF